MLHPELPVFGFLGAALVIIPLPRQVRTCNVACIAMIFWLFQHCIVSGVNAITWAGNTENSALIWCDMTIHLRYAGHIGLPAAGFCFCKHLEFIASGRRVPGFLQNHRIMFELVMCTGLPGVWIFMFHWFRVYRFAILENYGCLGPVYPSPAFFIFVLLLPLLLSVATLIYGTLTLYHLIYHQTSAKFLSQYLMSRNTTLSGSQFYRLVILCTVTGGWGVGWLVYSARISPDLPFLPSWKFIHQNASTIAQVQESTLDPHEATYVHITWWAVPGAALWFFFIFGTDPEALSEYPRFWGWFKITVLRHPAPVKTNALTTTFELDSVISFPRSVYHSPAPLHDDLESWPAAPTVPGASFWLD